MRSTKRILCCFLLAWGCTSADISSDSSSLDSSRSSTFVTLDWENDPSLDAEQVAILQDLQQQSSDTFTVDFRRDKGIITELVLDVPLPGDASQSDEERVLIFLRELYPLWRLPSPVIIDLPPVPSEFVPPDIDEPDCGRFSLIAKDPTHNVPIAGGAVTVEINSRRHVRRIVGQFPQPSLKPVDPSTITKEEALRILKEELGEDRIDGNADLAAYPVIFDREALGDFDDVPPAHAWQFDIYNEDPHDLYALFVVDALTRSVVVRRYMAEYVPSLCPLATGGGLTHLPRVVLDPYTNSPIITSFSNIGGLPTQGANAVERAYHVLKRHDVMSLYGTRNPERHLVNPEVRVDDNGFHYVSFDQHYGGIPVAGAGLTVSLDPTGKAHSIAGTFVFDPGIDVVPKVSEEDAKNAALQHFIDTYCGSFLEHDRTIAAECEDQVNQEFVLNPPSAELVVFTTEVFIDAPPIQPAQRLAWQVDFELLGFFVDALDGSILFHYWNAHGAYPSEIRGASGATYYLDDNYVYSGGGTQTEKNNAIWAQQIKLDIDSKQAALLGFDGMRENSPPRVEIEVGPYSWMGLLDRLEWASFRKVGDSIGRIRIPDWATTCADLLAHEFQHGFNAFTGKMRQYGYEGGAINESIADVVAQAYFPHPGWVLAKQCGVLVGGLDAIRNLADPEEFDMPGHVAFLDKPCNYAEILGIIPLIPDADCAHFWAGVPNRAAVLMSDGIQGRSHPGFGRMKVASLLLKTVQSWKLSKAHRFTQLAEGVYQQCKELHAEPDSRLDPFTPDDCSHVSHAYSRVGIESPMFYGFFAHKNSLITGSKHDSVFFEGDESYQGCYLTDQILVMRTKHGTELVSRWADGNEVILANGEAGARVTWRASSVDNTKREVRVRSWSEWNHWNVVQMEEEFYIPTGLQLEDCVAPEGTKRVILFSKESVHSWATFFDGHKGDRRVNWNVVMPPECTLGIITGIHYHDGVAQGQRREIAHQGHGYRVTPQNKSNRQLLGANLHWWHDGLTSIKARVAYHIFEDREQPGICLSQLSSHLRATP